MNCPSGKLRYASPQAAHAVIAKQGKRHEAQKRAALSWAKGRLTAYRCPMCGGWHTGHTTHLAKGNVA